MGAKREYKGKQQPNTEEEFDIDPEEPTPTWSDLLAAYYINRVGSMGTKNTEVRSPYDFERAERNIVLYIWDSTPDCTATKEKMEAYDLWQEYPDEYAPVHLCKAHKICTYKKVGKCATQVNYIKAIIKFVMENYGLTATESQFFQFGIHILPLYRMLCKMKVEELVVQDVVYGEGVKKAHPIYREIRETMKLITQLWKDSGMIKEKEDIPFPGAGSLMDGGGNYYEMVEGGGLKPLERDREGHPVDRVSRGNRRKKK